MDKDMELLAELIGYAERMGGTDLHVAIGSKPDVVVRGELYELGESPVVTANQMATWARSLCGDEGFARLGSGAEGAQDAVSNLGPLRVRFAFRRQRGGVAMTARLLPPAPPELSTLGVSPAVAALINRPNGLVIVSGPTGAGKSTLMASLVNEVNTHQSKHVLTIEDPVEYVHQQNRSRISQREVGVDVDSFGAALRSAVRSRPNIIVVGEMRDADTARAALDAASKGQLVLTTSHAGSAQDAIEGLVAMFPAEEQIAVAARVASVLQAVVVQQLIPNFDDTRVVPVREVMLRTDGIVGLIRNRQFNQLYQAIGATRDHPGMVRLEDDLFRLVHEGVIAVDTALAIANVRSELAARLDGFADAKRGARA